MFEPGHIIEMKDDVSYTVTKPGTKWLVYEVLNDNKIRIGTLPKDEHTAQRMITLYSRFDSHLHKTRRLRDNINLFSVYMSECRLSGNNKIFKTHLLQGDMWEEEKKPMKKSQSKMSSSFILRDEDWTPW